MNYTLNHVEIRDAVSKLCLKFDGKYWQNCDKNNSYPTEFVNALTEAGYLSALIPEEYGGLGLSLSVGVAILEEIHKSGCNAAACHAQMYTMGTLLRHGSEDQKQKYLPEIAKGNLRLQAFGVTEPTSGSDTTSLKCNAVKKGDLYHINGQKIWTSRAEHSDLLLLLARTTPKEKVTKRTDGLSVFIVDLNEVPKNTITIKPIRTMMNHSTTEIFFDNLPVPKRNLIGEEGKGFKYILSGMNAERILIAAECIGDAKWFINKASKYSSEREVFGRPIGKNQGIQFPIARSYSLMRAAELMLNEATNLFDKGLNPGEEANLSKLLSADAQWAAAEACIQTFGGFGFAEEYDIERKYREARLYQVAPISTNMILSYIAEHVLKMPRSY
tara:strand:- start:515 stop:1672 length:1158 start_codon:yes stop_codon:yes gene_type:complete